MYLVYSGKELDSRDTAYDLFVRAWFDQNTYAVYRSDGITPDVSPPQIKRKRAVRVSNGCPKISVPLLHIS